MASYSILIVLTHGHRVELMEYLQHLLDKINRLALLIAGLVGTQVASWRHKGWHAWVVSDRALACASCPAGESPAAFDNDRSTGATSQRHT